MTGDAAYPSADSVERRIRTILDVQHPLCREDVVWMLGYIKKKVADVDPAMLNLSQPRLLLNFLAFAEASMALIERRHYSDQEAGRLRRWLAEASYGLTAEKRD